MSTTRDHQLYQLQKGQRPAGDPECRLCHGTGTTGKPRRNGTVRPCACVRRGFEQAKREAGR